MNRPVQGPIDPEIFLRHARCTKAPLDHRRIVSLVSESIERYEANSEAAWNDECARLLRTEEHIDRALAVILADHYTFEDDDEFAPFRTEEEAYSWLQGDGPNPDARDTDWLMDRNSNWTIASLWKVRQEINQQWEDIQAWRDAEYDVHWNRTPENSSRLPSPIQDIISEVCRIWHDYVDEDLKLPRRDPDPDNPLLRFLDEILAIALGKRRPPKKSLLQFVQRVVRPALRQEDEESEHDQHRRRFASVDSVDAADRFDVDFDPFSDDWKSPR